MRGLLARFKRERRVMAALSGLPWFRAGYYAGVADRDRNLVYPEDSDSLKTRAADDALKRWVDS
jgi:hypothetical protein